MSKFAQVTFNAAMHALADYPGQSRADEALALYGSPRRSLDPARGSHDVS